MPVALATMQRPDGAAAIRERPGPLPLETEIIALCPRPVVCSAGVATGLQGTVVRNDAIP